MQILLVMNFRVLKINKNKTLIKKFLKSFLVFFVAFSTILSSFPPEAYASATTIRQEINILDGTLTSSGTLESNARVLLDTTKYNGTATYYFEAVYNGASGNTGTIKLSRAGTSTYDASINGATSTTYTLTRTSSFTPPTGQTEYTVTLVGDGSRTQNVKAARIIVIQNANPMTSTQTQIEIGNTETGKTNTSASALNAPKYWQYDSSKWDGTQTFYAETTWRKTNGSPQVPTFVGAGSAVSGTAAVSPAWPTHQVDDIGIMVIETGGEGTTLTPSGWTHVTGSPVVDFDTTAGSKLHILWRRATSSSESAVSTGDSGDHQVARIFVFRGVVTSGNPWDVVTTGNKTTASTTATNPSVTTTVNNTLVLLIAGRPNDNASTTHFDNFSNSNLSNITEHGEAGTTSGHGGGFVLSSGTKSTAGSTGTSTSTKSVSTTDTYMTLALRPDSVNVTFTARLQESDGTGDGFTGWTDKVTIVNASSTDATTTRTRSSSFTPVNGRNYRIVTSQSGSNATHDIYNAKIIVDQTDGTAITKLEPQYLLANNRTAFSSNNLDQSWLTKWDSTDWSGVNTIFTHAVDAANNSTSDVGITPTTSNVASETFSFSEQTTSGRGSPRFKPDGTKMYIATDDSSNRVYQYSLSTPWDITTATYENKFFSFTSQGSDPASVLFSDDGTKMYASLGGSNAVVYQYALSIAWDVSTASYANKSFTLGQATNNHAGFFKSDGTKLYSVNWNTTNGTVYQYSLSTAWDISTASYDNVSLNTGIQYISNVSFSSDGNNLYVSRYLRNIRRFSLPTAWTLTGGTLANEYFLPGTDSERSLFIKDDDGMLFVNNKGNSTVEKFSMPITHETGSINLLGVVENPDNQGISNSFTMPSSQNLDVRVTTNNSDIYGSRILVAVSPPIIGCTSQVSSGNWNSISTWNCGRVPAATDDITIATGHTITMNANSAALGAITINGTLNTSDGTSRSLTGTSLSIGSAGTLTANSSTITLSGTGTSVFSKHENGTFTAGTSTVRFTGNGDVTIPAVSYYNLTLSPNITSNRTYTLNASSISNNLDINPDGSSELLVNMGANLTVTGTTTIQKTNNATSKLDAISGTNRNLSTGYINIGAGGTYLPRNSTVTITGTSGTLFTLNGSGTFTAGGSTVNLSGNGSATVNSGSPTFYNLTSSGTGTKTLGAGITLASGGTLTVSAGTFDPSSHTVTGSGSNTLTVSNATLAVGGSTFADSYSAGFGTINLNSGSTVNYNRGGNQTIRNDLSYVNLSTSTSGTKTLGGNTTVTTNVNIGSSSTLGLSSHTLTLSGTGTSLITGSGTLNGGTGTVKFTGNGSVTVPDYSYYNLELNPTITDNRIYTLNASTVNGNFTINPVASSALSLTANMGANLAVAGITTITKTTNATGILDTRPSSTSRDLITGYLSIQTGGTLDAGDSTSNITLSGTTGTLFTLNGGVFTPGSSTVNLSGNGNATINSGSPTFYNLTISGTGTKTAGSALTINGSLNISNANGTFDANYFNMEILGNVVNQGTFSAGIPGSSDDDATAFINATGITSNTQKAAINNLVYHAKLHGWWDKTYAIYPFVGGTSSTTAVNLKSPGTYNITWNGTPTFASTGVSGWSSSNYGNTNFIPSDNMTLDDNHISIYSRTNVAEYSDDFIAGDGDYGFILRDQYNILILKSGSGTSIGLSSHTDSRGFYVGLMNGTRKIYKNGIQLVSYGTGQYSQASTSARIGYAGYSGASTKEFVLATLGTALSPTEISDMYNDVQAFQTALGREVGSPQSWENDQGNPGPATNTISVGGDWLNTGTVSAGESTIKLTGTSGTKTFAGGNQTYHDLWLAGGSNGVNYVISGNNTFNDFKSDGSVAHMIQFTAGSTQTLETFSVAGTNGNVITLTSTTSSPFNLVKTSITDMISDYLQIQYSNVSPYGEWLAGIHSVNLGSNTGWIFNTRGGSRGGGVGSAGGESSGGGTPVGGGTGQGGGGGGSGGEGSGGGTPDTGGEGTCSDGIQNGNETGIDTGGRCSQGGGGGGDVGYLLNKKSLLANTGGINLVEIIKFLLRVF